jgi:hypothetical protein
LILRSGNDPAAHTVPDLGGTAFDVRQTRSSIAPAACRDNGLHSGNSVLDLSSKRRPAPPIDLCQSTGRRGRYRARMQPEIREQTPSPDVAPKCYRCGQVTTLVSVIPRFGHTPAYRIFECHSCHILNWVEN